MHCMKRSEKIGKDRKRSEKIGKDRKRSGKRPKGGKSNGKKPALAIVGFFFWSCSLPVSMVRDALAHHCGSYNPRVIPDLLVMLSHGVFQAVVGDSVEAQLLKHG